MPQSLASSLVRRVRSSHHNEIVILSDVGRALRGLRVEGPAAALVLVFAFRTIRVERGHGAKLHTLELWS